MNRYVAALLLLAGCASSPPVPLDRAVVSYDIATADGISQQLLLNIARANVNEPIHFTAVTSIAATYRLSTSAGIGPTMTGEHGRSVLPLLGVVAEQNPTISISPMQGDEFTQRLLTPFREAQLTLLLRQDYDVDALLRLLGASVRIDESGAEYPNRPSDHDGYVKYRQMMAHLSTIQDRHALHVEPLHFNHTWTIPEASFTPETFESTYKEFTVSHDAAAHVYNVSRRVNGRVMITNFNPDALSNEERVVMHRRAEEAPPNEVVIDIRPGYPGGEYPIEGRLRLRSFHEVLTFIGRGISEEPEFDVAPDPRTPAMSENPRSALEVVEMSAPPKRRLFVKLNGKYYAIASQSGYQWNQKAFDMLYQLFQMSVSASAQSGPSITIAK